MRRHDSSNLVPVDQITNLPSMQPHSGMHIFSSTALSTGIGAVLGAGLTTMLGSPRVTQNAIDVGFFAGAIQLFTELENNRKIHQIKHELDLKYGDRPR